jgi:hypothetical protein
MSQSTYIPRADEVSTGSGIPNWRFSDGQIVRGRELEGTLVSTERLVGRLLRVGVHRGTLDDGRPYGKLECEIETADGVQSAGANLTSKMAAITLGEGLLAAAKDQLIAISAARSRDRNKFGTFTTYVNVFSVEERSFHTTQIREKRLDREKSLDEVLEDMETELRAHPAWGERAKREEREDQGAVHQSPWQLLEQEVAAAGYWPSVPKAWKGYLEMASAVSKVLNGKATKYETTADVPEDVVAQLRDGHSKSAAAKSAIPKALQPYVADESDYDPFA